MQSVCSILLFLLFSLSLTPCRAAGFLEQGAKVSFDDKNFLVFEDVGRSSYGGGFTAGSGVRLHVTRDGQSKTINLPEDSGVTSQVEEIRYTGKDRVWITSRLGRMAYGVALINLASGGVERHYAGAAGSFTFSPDGERVAYYNYPDPRRSECVEVYVNDLMIYPRVVLGIPDDRFDEERAKLSKGAASRLRWLNAGTLTFLIRQLGPEDEDRDTEKSKANAENTTFESYTVSGIKPQPGQPWRVTVEKTTLTADETRNLMKAPRTDLTTLTIAANASTTRTTVIPAHAPTPTPRPRPRVTYIAPPTPTPIPNHNVQPLNFFGGVFGGAALGSGFACIAQGLDLRVLDISTSTPRPLGKLILPDLTHGLSVSGSLAWVSLYGRVQLVDLTHPAAPRLRGVCPLPMLAPRQPSQLNDLATSGALGCAVGDFGFAVIDAANPDAPRLDPIQGESWPGNKVALSGRAAFVIDGFYGLRVVDLSNPKAPVLRATLSLPSHAAAALAISGKRAFISLRDKGIQTIDISNPFSPRLGPLYPLRGIYNLASSGGRLFAGMSKFTPVNVPWFDLRILDVSDPSSITEHALPLLPGNPGVVAAAGNLLGEATAEGGMRVFDLTNPAAPALRGTSPQSLQRPWGLATISSNRVCLMDGMYCIKIVDLSNPLEPVVAGVCQVGTIVRSMTASGSMIYVGDDRDGLRVIDAANPAAPRLRGTFPLNHNAADALAVSGTLVHAATRSSRYCIIDVSNPDAPRLRSRPAVDVEHAIALAGKMAYAEGGGKLTALDITNPDAPVVAGAIEHIPATYQMQAVGSLLYLATAPGLEIYDVANPAKPVLRGALPIPGCRSIQVAGNRAYLAAEESDGLRIGDGVRVVDISHPEQPRLAGAYSGFQIGQNPGIAAIGPYIYLSAEPSGLGIFKY